MNKIKFKKALKDKTSCTIQHNGWTCGSCFFAISDDLTQTDWNVLLIYRGDYSEEETQAWRKEEGFKPLTKKEKEHSLNKIWELIKSK